MDEPCSQQAWGVSGLLSRPLPPRCPAPALTSCRPCLTAHALLFVPWCKPIVQPVGTKGTAGRRFLMSGELDCVRTACVRRHPDVLSLCRTLATAPARRACAPRIITRPLAPASPFGCPLGQQRRGPATAAKRLASNGGIGHQQHVTAAAPCADQAVVAPKLRAEPPMRRGQACARAIL